MFPRVFFTGINPQLATTLSFVILLQVVIGTFAGAGSLAVQGLLASFMVPYVVSRGHVDRQTALYMLSGAYVLMIVAIPFFAWLSDRFGRKPVMVLSGLAGAVLVFPMFGLFDQADPIMTLLGFLLGAGIVHAAMFGPYGAFLSEKYAPEARYTGASLSYQLSSILGAGTIPLIANEVVGPTNGITILAWYMIALFGLSIIAVLASKETSGPRAVTMEWDQD